MFRSCVHTHTNFCDGTSTAEEMVLAALSHSFVSLGFSGHCCSAIDPCSMTAEGELAYRAEIQRLQTVYGKRLEILLGVEHEGLAPYSSFPYDYQIESLHWITHNGIFIPIDWSQERFIETATEHFGGNYYNFCQAYFEACMEVYSHSPAQICGHLDLVTKFNDDGRFFDMTDPRYLRPAIDALEAAVRHGMVIELNTGAIARGYRTAPYPSLELLSQLRKLGGEIIVTSDCHQAKNLTCWYSQAEELLRHCGFTHTLVLRKNGFQELPLG